MNEPLYEFIRTGMIIRVPINIYLQYVKYFNLLWEERTTTFTTIHQIVKNKDFLNELSREGYYSSSALGFLLSTGCPSIKIKVVEPLLFYK